VLLMARAGLRRAEVLGLRRSDVHLLADSRVLGCEVARAHLHVVRREDNPNGAVAKSRRQRVVPLDFVTVQAFDAARARGRSSIGVRGQVHRRASAVAMAHNAGTPRLLAKCGSAVEVLDKQQIEDPALACVEGARTTGHTDNLPAMAPHSSRLEAGVQQPGGIISRDSAPSTAPPGRFQVPR
jgi:hypothetical protein